MKIIVLGKTLNAKVAASMFASVGNTVLVECKKELALQFLKEPGLSELYSQQVASGRVKDCDLLVKTGDIADNNAIQAIDLVIAETANEIALFIDREKKRLSTNSIVFVILAPSSIGEAQNLSAKFVGTESNHKVCSLPLLVREGRAIADFSRPESILVGCDNEDAFSKIRSLLHPFNRVKDVIKQVSAKEAEFSAFASHGMLATRLSFMNEMASLAERTNVDIDIVRDCIGRDPRIGQDYLYPGCGFGGEALETNVKKVAKQLKQRSDDLGLLETVLRINDRQKELLFRKIWKFFGGELENKTIAIWGASFKPGSPNLTGAPSMKLIELLLAQRALVKIYDPQAGELLREKFAGHSDVMVSESAYEATNEADCLAICTEWKEFWSPDFKKLSSQLVDKVIFDGRNILDIRSAEDSGIKYFGIGRNKVKK